MLSRSQKLITIALLLTIPTSHSEAGFAAICQGFLSSVQSVASRIDRIATYPGEKLNDLYARLRLWGKFDELNFDAFDEATLKFQTHPEALPTEGVIEEEIAYWEARLQNLPEREKEISLRPTLKSGSWKDRYLLYRSIRGEGYDPIAYFRSLIAMKSTVRASLDPQAIRTEQITRFLDDVYLMQHFDMKPNFRDLLSFKREEALNRKLMLAAERQVDRVGLEKFFHSRGALTNPRVGDLAKQFTESNAWAATVFALTNLGIRDGLLGYVPKLEFTRAIKKWGPRMYTDGISNHWAAFVKEFRNGQMMEAGADAFRVAWMTAGTVVLGVLVYNEMTKAQNAMEGVTEGVQNLVDHQNEELKQIKAMTPGEFAFHRWKNRYKAKHGGAEPDPKSTDYQEAHDLYIGAAK